MTASPHFSLLETRWIAEHPTLRYRRLSGSLLSADLSGFTALSERLASRGKEGSERLTVMVNGCFDALIRAAGHEGGDVLKFGGDALLVWFEGDGHQVRAVTAGARMQRAIGAARFSRAGLGMSVGAHTGDFDLFLVGPKGWRELVLAGSPVTTTVNLEAAADRGEVLVSPELAARLPKALLGARREVGIPLALSKLTLPRMAAPAPSAASVPAKVPERILADEQALAGVGGEHRLATIVFAELDGTDARVAADPEGMADRLDSLLLATHEKADRYRLRFLYTDVIADGVKLICTAGAPISTGEDEEAGLRFATDLVAGDALHRLHVGVNRGRVFAGFLGGQSRHTYTVMGDPVNLSARLMVKAKPGQVVAADDVVRRSRATFRLTPLSPFLVKGKQHPIKAHVVGALTGDRQLQANSALPIVGRESELAALHDAITAAGVGDGCVVDIAGDAGIGKSRLIEAVAEDPRLVVRIATECQPYDGLSPYASARTLLRRALGIPISASAAVAGRQLAATAARLAPESVPMLPLLAVALGAEMAPTPESEAVAGQFRTARMHETAASLLTAALPQTTLLVVEDIYYADDASLQLFRALSVEIAQRPWVLVVTRRPDGAGFLGEERRGVRLELTSLADDEVARLTEIASGGAGFHPMEQRAVAQRAGGNPLFLLQLVASAQAGESADELPESIERVLASRIDRLDPADRAVLRQAAVLGRVFHAGVLDALRAADGAAALDAHHWDALSDLVEPASAGRWRFRHALFRDVAYEGLPFARRRRMHKDVGELLEAGVAGEPDAALLSEHFWLAGDAERTWRYSLAAGDQAWRAYAVSESIAAYQRALGVRRRVRGLPTSEVASAAESLGDVLERAARYEEADAAFMLARRAARETQRAAGNARLLRKRATVSERLGNYPRSNRLYRAALGVCVEAGDSTERAQVELGLAGLSLRLGKPDELATWAGRAIDDAREAGDSGAVAYGHLLLVAAATFDMAIDPREHAATALKEFRASGERHLEGKVLNNLGIVQYFGGDWAEAADSYRAASEAFAASGDVVEESNARNNLAEVLSDQGHVEAASSLFADSLQLWTNAGYAIGVAVATSNLGRARVRSGAFAEGLSLLETARTLFADLGAGTYVLDTSARLAEAMVLAGDPEAAVELLAQLDADPGSSFPAVAVARLRVRGWAMISMGRDEEAGRLLLRAAQEANAAEIPFEEVLSLRGLELIGSADADRHRSAADALSERLGVVGSPRVPVLA